LYCQTKSPFAPGILNPSEVRFEDPDAPRAGFAAEAPRVGFALFLCFFVFVFVVVLFGF
jgi:hypothetical protein